MRAAAALTPWVLTTAPASPPWCWTAPDAAASPTRARASVAPPPDPPVPPPRSALPPHAPNSNPISSRCLRLLQADWLGVRGFSRNQRSQGSLPLAGRVYLQVDYSPGAPASFRPTGCNGDWWLWGILFLLWDLVLLSAEAALPVMISLCVSVSFHLSGLSGISATLGVFLGLFLFISLFPSLCIFAFLFFLESLILGMYLSLSLWVLSFCPLT